MRTFVILGHTAAITPNITLNDLPGSAGRLDILCRCVTAAFCLSHGIRRDVEVFLILQDRVTIYFDGKCLKHLNPDERSTGALIQKALEALRQAAPNQEDEVRSTPGITVAQSALVDVLAKIRPRADQIVWLHEAGCDLRAEKLSASPVFVLSDHLDFTREEEVLLQHATKLSVGPKILHADHCITIVHNELDRHEPLP
jgi:tRNA (pseudouridine54-N1)-methyltransferase